MISRFLRRPPPPARVTHFTPRAYLEARAGGRGLVRVELAPQSSAAPPRRADDGAAHAGMGGSGAPAESDPAGAPFPPEPAARITTAEDSDPSPGAGGVPPLQYPGAAAYFDGAETRAAGWQSRGALDALAHHYGNPNVND